GTPQGGGRPVPRCTRAKEGLILGVLFWKAGLTLVQRGNRVRCVWGDVFGPRPTADGAARCQQDHRQGSPDKRMAKACQGSSRSSAERGFNQSLMRTSPGGDQRGVRQAVT